MATSTARRIRRVFTSHILAGWGAQPGSRVNMEIIKTNSNAGLPRAPRYFSLLTFSQPDLHFGLTAAISGIYFQHLTFNSLNYHRIEHRNIHMNSNSQNASDISKLESEISRNLDCWKDISCLITNVQSSLKYVENWNYIKCHSDSFIGISSHNLRVGRHIFRGFSLVSSAVYNSWEEYKDLHQKQGRGGGRQS